MFVLSCGPPVLYLSWHQKHHWFLTCTKARRKRLFPGSVYTCTNVRAAPILGKMWLCKMKTICKPALGINSIQKKKKKLTKTAQRKRNCWTGAPGNLKEAPEDSQKKGKGAYRWERHSIRLHGYAVAWLQLMSSCVSFLLHHSLRWKCPGERGLDISVQISNGGLPQGIVQADAEEMSPLEDSCFISSSTIPATTWSCAVIVGRPCNGHLTENNSFTLTAVP